VVIIRYIRKDMADGVAAFITLVTTGVVIKGRFD
jgi:hypothetical protein